MYCIHCGKKLPDDTIFCIYCGKKQVSDEKSSQDIESQEKVMAPNLSTKADDDSNSSKDVEVDQTSEAHSPTFKELAHELGGIGSMIFQESGSLLNSEAKVRNDTVCPFCKENDSQPVQKNIAEVESQNYKWGKGCCGILLLGPFGLLCGLCGTGTKSKASSELWWTCMKCGKQHLALDDALKKWDAWISALLISAITSGIIFSIFRWLEFGIVRVGRDGPFRVG